MEGCSDPENPNFRGLGYTGLGCLQVLGSSPHYIKISMS